MISLQEWFDKNISKNVKHISLKGKTIKEELEGTELIIEDFSQLQYICVCSLPQLTTLIIKNCEELENLKLLLDKKINIELVGDFPKLKSFELSNNQEQNIIIQQADKPKKCGWVCFFGSVIIIWTIGLTYGLYRIIKKQKAVVLLNQKLRKKLAEQTTTLINE